MRSFCLLASMQLILIPNCSLLYLHSNGVNSLKNVFLKKKYIYIYISYKYNCYIKPQIMSAFYLLGVGLMFNITKLCNGHDLFSILLVCSF